MALGGVYIVYKEQIGKVGPFTTPETKSLYIHKRM